MPHQHHLDAIADYSSALAAAARGREGVVVVAELDLVLLQLLPAAPLAGS